MNAGLDWDEFRLIKAIADARSLVGAAEALGLNHSTFSGGWRDRERRSARDCSSARAPAISRPSAGEEMIALAEDDGRIRSSNSSGASPGAT